MPSCPPPSLQLITFFEEGEPIVDGEPGDLKFMIRPLPDSRWERRGDDLLINETISLVDALTGFSREIEHLDGHKVRVGVDVSRGWGCQGAMWLRCAALCAAGAAIVTALATGCRCVVAFP